MKNLSLVLFLAFAFLQGQAQEIRFTIKGKTEIMPQDGKMLLLRNDSIHGKRVDTARVGANGKFSFTASVPEVDLGQIIYKIGNGTGGIVFFYDQGVIHITIKKGKRHPALSGTPLNKDLSDYYVLMDHMLDSLNAVRAPYPNGMKYTEYDYHLGKEKLQVMEQFVPTHPNSPVTVLELYYNVSPYRDEAADFARLYNELTPEMQNTTRGREMATMIRGMGSTKVGETAIDFSLPDSAGRPVKLSDFRGKYVLLDFWATWCPPCMEEMPNIAAVYQKYRHKNFTVLGVSLDSKQTEALWKKTIRERHMDWPQISDLKFWYSEAALLYNVQGVPANFLIGPDGRIVGINLLGEALRQKLDELFPQQ